MSRFSQWTLLVLRKCKVEIIPLVVMIAFFAVVFRKALFGGRFLLVGDPLRQLYPLRMVAWEVIRNGALPLWTPYILSGYPMFSMIMLGIGYPVTWGYLFLPGPWAEQIYILAPYFLAPIFTYAFLRELGRSPLASVLGGLVFGYSGFLFSPIGLTGVHANSALWMPLVLLGIARARRGSFLPPLLLSTFAYTMSILAGSGQMFLYAGSLAVAYGAFLTLFPPDDYGSAAKPRFRWQPLAIATGSILLSIGLTAFQILETWTATSLSVRRAYPAERFSEGSFPPMFAWHSLLQPLGNYWDSATYVPLLAAGLAIIAVMAAVRHPRQWPQIFFWLVAAIVAWLLILGNHTPLFRLYRLLPFVSRFRYPSRHTLEWTFAIGVLAAFGWDAAECRVRKLPHDGARWPTILIGTASVLLAGFFTLGWGRLIVQSGLDQISDLNNAITQLNGPYLGWKTGFTLSIILALGLFCRLPEGSLRTALLATTIGLACIVEPFLWMVRPIAEPWSVTAEQFSSFGEATRILQKQLGPYERNYSGAHPYAVPSVPVRDLDAVNWTALAGIQDANGYESLILERYSWALRGNIDAEPFVSPNPELLDPSSRVLDLLNVRFVTSYADFSAVPPAARIEKAGISFSSSDLAVDLPRFVAFSLHASGLEADTLALVTTMANSGLVAQGEPVARLTIHGVDGHLIERYLRAGIDTSEWAHDRADVKATVRHARAPIFDSAPGDPQGSFESHRFLARVNLGERLRVDRVDIVNIASTASVGLWKAALHDSVTQRSRPLPEPSSTKWKTVHEKNGVTILENLRVLPRAWLVTKVEALDKAEILRRIRGSGNAAFDPQSSALVELNPREVPPLSGEPLPADSSVRIVKYEPNRIVLKASSRQPTMLVVSEIHYPGWIATVDGAETPIHQTDYLLRGVFLPAGTHTVEMACTAPGARKGAGISLVTMLLLLAMTGRAIRTRLLHKVAPGH
ncbi:MAG TPA: hypothetical protein VHL58_15415 [Thermoanaerobaculia bacterium]|nr:hypothetical protein [Thermoanaerobaculia bacterium]